ncbi:MAG: asparaginase domain-containing protein, partial [Solirubrobacteraceae bacterium]
PIVVTGAMRNPALLGADGPANLAAAIRVAVSAECRGLGCVVVFNDEIHAGRYVRKTHTTSLATFRSPTVGPLGWISEAGPRFALRPGHRRWLPVEKLGEIPPVALITLGMGDDGRLLDVVADCGYRGAVVEALGGGHAPAKLVGPLEALAGRMPVVLASRAGSGEGLRHTYGFPGSEEDLLGRGLIWAGALDGPKARVLLGLALAASSDRAGVLHLFDAIAVPNTVIADGVVSL